MKIRAGFVLGLLLALGVAGCGGSDGDDGVATAGSPGSKASSSAPADGLSDQERGLKFAQCMRENGVPNFPDPTFNDGGGMGINVPDGTDPQKVDAAMQQCKQYLPNGGEPQKMDPQLVEQQRKFSQCMRENGVPKFPDPGEDGGIQLDGNTLGVDPVGPEIKAAEKACAKYQPARPSGDPGPRTNTGGNS